MSSLSEIKNFSAMHSFVESKVNSLNMRADCSADNKQVKEICGNLFILSGNCSSPQNTAAVQVLVYSFFCKIRPQLELPSMEDSRTELLGLMKTNIFNLPDETTLESFSFLPVPELLKLRRVCQHYRDLIDSSYLLQTRIAHHYLLSILHLSTIPLDDIKFFLRDNRLAIEINNDLSVLHLAENFAQVIPWTSNLVVRNCKAAQLERLLSLLKDSKRLTTLFLCDCELDSACIAHLQAMQHPGNEVRRIPNFYFCNVRASQDASLPDELLSNSERVRIILKENSHEYLIDRFLGQETDLNSLNELELQVFNREVPANNVLEVFDSIRDVIRARIIESIWYSTLMDDMLEEKKATPVYMIDRQVREYIGKHPHHPAVLSAARTRRDEYLEPTVQFNH